MIQQRAWGVGTATAQSEIIGRRHYGRKALAARWRRRARRHARAVRHAAAVAPQRHARRQRRGAIEVPLNDSLTSFRLVAVADAGVQRFGTGSASINVTQDLQVLSGLPPLVREGDRFSRLLTLRNTTAREMKLRATLAGTANSGSGAEIVARR
jgi:uncharacterized protein YfaS (alpha-2-macroglobulin family)